MRARAGFLLLLALGGALGKEYVPNCRKGHVADVWMHKDRAEMVVFGGKANAKESHDDEDHGAIYLDDVWTLDIGEDSYEWTHLKSHSGESPEHRWKTAGGVMDDDELVIFGGHNGRKNHKDYLRDTWNFREGFGWEHVDASGTLLGRRGHSAVVADDQLFVFGGKSEESECLRDTWILDFSELGTKEWRESTLFPGACRWGHSASPVTDAEGDVTGMLVFGGREKVAAGTYQYYNDLWFFDLASETWAEANVTSDARPPERNHHASAHLGRLDAVVVHGGRDSDSLDVPPLNDLWVYDVASGRWTELTEDAPTDPRFLHTAVQWHDGESVVVFGGETEPSKKGKSRHLNDVWLFHVESNEWRHVAKNHCDVDTPALHALLSDKVALTLVGGFAGGALLCGLIVYWRQIHARQESRYRRVAL